MSHDNPFAKLGALDQQLYQDTKTHDANRDIASETKPGENQEVVGLLANQQTSKPTKKKASIPTNLQTNKLANQQTSTQHLSTKEKKNMVPIFEKIAYWKYRFMLYKIKGKTMRYYKTR